MPSFPLLWPFDLQVYFADIARSIRGRGLVRELIANNVMPDVPAHALLKGSWLRLGLTLLDKLDPYRIPLQTFQVERQPSADRRLDSDDVFFRTHVEPSLVHPTEIGSCCRRSSTAFGQLALQVIDLPLEHQILPLELEKLRVRSHTASRSA